MSNEENLSSPEIKADELDVLKLEIEIWKKTIEVQQHFNDIELRIRNIAVTLLGGLLAATALALNSNRKDTAILLLIAALIIWLAFYFMDQYWYHQLLRGAVCSAQAIESRLNEKLPSLKLALTISQASKVKIPILNKKTNSTMRLNFFYIVVAVVLILGIISISLFAPSPTENNKGTINASPTTTLSSPITTSPSPVKTATILVPSPTNHPNITVPTSQPNISPTPSN